ncbi:MAG: hypothetical protein JXB50_12680 [Spirochaetes bacterium]|nr:hypothetical protein [Spirochaetota bacterium]
MNIFICKVCGHIEFNAAPGNCPVCYAPKEKFEQNDKIFIESEEKSKEAAPKHIPLIQIIRECHLIKEQKCTDVLVRIGEVLHPMEEKHYIMFIDCYLDYKYISRVMLTPDVWASGLYHLKKEGKKVTIVERCNIHGFWMAEASV